MNDQSKNRPGSSSAQEKLSHRHRRLIKAVTGRYPLPIYKKAGPFSRNPSDYSVQACNNGPQPQDFSRLGKAADAAAGDQPMQPTLRPIRSSGHQATRPSAPARTQPRHRPIRKFHNTPPAPPRDNKRYISNSTAIANKHRNKQKQKQKQTNRKRHTST